jgi:hypothetical protein
MNMDTIIAGAVSVISAGLIALFTVRFFISYYNDNHHKKTPSH